MDITKLCAKICADDPHLLQDGNLIMRQSIHLPELLQEYAQIRKSLPSAGGLFDPSNIPPQLVAMFLILDAILLEKYEDQAKLHLKIFAEGEK